MFNEIYNQQPLNITYGIPCFGNEDDGDFFTEEELSLWNSEFFHHKLSDKKFIENSVTNHLLSELSNEKKIIDLASGPGMGLISSILQIHPNILCMVIDANFSVLRKWNAFLSNNTDYNKTTFAQFSLMDIPFHSNSVEAYSSFIGLSSTRNGQAGYNRVTSEVFRTLRPGGKLFAVEVDWTDIPLIIDLFNKINQKPWDIFTEAIDAGNLSWEKRLKNAGFTILYQDLFEYRKLSKSDNELGRAAENYGYNIGMNFTAFIAQKE